MPSLPQEFRAISIDQYGGPDVLKHTSLPLPKIGPSELLIETAYAGVNPVDWKIREGYLEGRLATEFPIIPGWDVSGKVVAKGDKVKQFSIGDAVMAYCRPSRIKYGSYASYVPFLACHTVKKPNNLSFAEAATVPLAALTAWQVLHDVLQIQKNDTLLIQAGAGGVGVFAIQFAKRAGAYVITTASSKNHSYLKELGADLTIDYHKEDFYNVIKSQFNDGIHAVLEAIGGSTLEKSIKTLMPGGYIVSITEPPPVDLLADANVYGSFHFVRPSGSQLAKIGSLIQEGHIRTPHVEILPLEQAANAQNRQKEGKVQGKLVLSVNP